MFSHLSNSLQTIAHGWQPGQMNSRTPLRWVSNHPAFVAAGLYLYRFHWADHDRPLDPPPGMRSPIGEILTPPGLDLDVFSHLSNSLQTIAHGLRLAIASTQSAATSRSCHFHRRGLRRRCTSSPRRTSPGATLLAPSNGRIALRAPIPRLSEAAAGMTPADVVGCLSLRRAGRGFSFFNFGKALAE